MIFVTVGSRNYPFDRLFIELDKLYDKGIIKDSMFAQIGTSTYKPKNFEYKDFISQEEFLEKVKDAIIKIQNGTDDLKKWENKDPMAIVNMIDKFIEENWK